MSKYEACMAEKFLTTSMSRNYCKKNLDPGHTGRKQALPMLPLTTNAPVVQAPSQPKFSFHGCNVKLPKAKLILKIKTKITK